MSYTLKTTHVSQGLGRLIGQYKAKPKLRAVLASYLTQIQLLEQAIYDVYTQRLLPNAEGVQLDVLGKLIGEKRNGRSDEIFRIWIQVRIKINRSFGRWEDILGIFHPDWGGFEDVLQDGGFNDYPPAGFRLDVLRAEEISVPLSEVEDIIKEVKAAGVAYTIVQPTKEWSGSVFSFCDLANLPGEGHSGFADLVSPDPEIGGYFSHVVSS